MEIKLLLDTNAIFALLKENEESKKATYTADAIFISVISESAFRSFTNLSESDRNLFDSSIYKIQAKKRERAKNLSFYKAADSDLLIELPAFNPAKKVTAPKGTTGLQLTFTAAVLSFRDQDRINVYPQIGTFLMKIKWCQFLKLFYLGWLTHNRWCWLF